MERRTFAACIIALLVGQVISMFPPPSKSLCDEPDESFTPMSDAKFKAVAASAARYGLKLEKVMKPERCVHPEDDRWCIRQNAYSSGHHCKQYMCKKLAGQLKVVTWLKGCSEQAGDEMMCRPISSSLKKDFFRKEKLGLENCYCKYHPLLGTSHIVCDDPPANSFCRHPDDHTDWIELAGTREGKNCTMYICMKENSGFAHVYKQPMGCVASDGACLPVSSDLSTEFHRRTAAGESSCHCVIDPMTSQRRIDCDRQEHTYGFI